LSWVCLDISCENLLIFPWHLISFWLAPKFIYWCHNLANELNIIIDDVISLNLRFFNLIFLLTINYNCWNWLVCSP
jgi:hypothetical protein